METKEILKIINDVKEGSLPKDNLFVVEKFIQRMDYDCRKLKDRLRVR